MKTRTYIGYTTRENFKHYLEGQGGFEMFSVECMDFMARAVYATRTQAEANKFVNDEVIRVRIRVEELP